MRRAIGRVGSGLLALALLGGCGNSSGGNGGGGPEVSPEVAAELVEDRGGEADAIAEVAPEPEDLRNQASLFPNNPAKDEWQTSRVTLGGIDSEDGSLTGPYANVFNCVNEDGGWMREYDVVLFGLPFGLVKVQLCNLKKTVFPDPDGSYLSVVPPEDLLDPSDPFSELMAFYHVNAIHDYYRTVHGYEAMDFPLATYVNLQGYLWMENPLPDIPQGWIGLDNAMYMPGESVEELEEYAEAMIKEYLGIEDDLQLPFEGDGIYFFQGEKVDFGYDADVIYHEYTHAVVGGERLWGDAADSFGIDPSPSAVNEAYADYFACTVTGDPLASEYALGTLGGDSGRDLTQFHRCPDHLFGEEHLDGRIYSNALWMVREALGQELADRIIFQALPSFDLHTTFEQAALATIAEAALLEPSREQEVKAIFEERGVLGCNGRVKPYAEKVQGETHADWLPGTQTTGWGQFADGTPNVVQYELEVAEGTTALLVEALAESGGLGGILGGFLNFGGEVELSLALRSGEPVQYLYEPQFERLQDGLVELVKEKGVFSVVVSGDCLTPGKHYLQFVNRSGDTVLLSAFRVTQLTDPFEGEGNYICR